jgi:fucose 4-O-acetylase-like acetyltransferase
MSKTRIEYFDAIKAFAIFLVVYGHTLQYLDKLQTGKCLHDFIYSFHMPLFMVVSGYFASSLQNNIYPFITKKLRQLILPVII